MRLRARAYAALGREVEARADFESSLDWERARVRAGKFLAHLDPDLRPLAPQTEIEARWQAVLHARRT